MDRHIVVRIPAALLIWALMSSALYGQLSPIPVLGITTTSLAAGQVGVPYSQTLMATGGTGAYT